MARNQRKMDRNRRIALRKSRRSAWLSVEALEPRWLLSTNVTSYHMDLQSTGVNNTETLLTVGNVNTTTFARTSSTPLDGQAYAEPLYVAGVNITVGNFPGIRNVVFAATEHDGLYAIDSSGGNVLWYDSFLNPALSGVAIAGATSITSVPAGDVGSQDINPEIGITGTPTIDVAQNALFVIAKTKQISPTGTHYVATLFKINIQSGAVIASHIIGDTIKNGGAYTYRTQVSASDPNQDPFVFGNGDGQITVPGTTQSRVYFNALRQMSRPGITLFNGQIYTEWASHGDQGPYHGWVLRFDENTLALTGVLNTTPNGGLGGIWQGGDIMTMDPHLDANNNPVFYFETGNGSFDTTLVTTPGPTFGFPINGNYSDCFVKIGIDTTTTQASQNINGWGFKVLDYFSPFNNLTLNGGDTDLGSGGTTILPDALGSAAHPHLLVGSGKEGKVYLIDRDNMGKFDPNTDHVIEEPKVLSGVLNAAAYFNNAIYYVPGYGGTGARFSIANGSAMYSASPTGNTSDTFGNLSGSPTISANGTTNAIMWALSANGDNTLRAYNASSPSPTLATLWKSNQAAGNRDALVGTVNKFTVPTVADGRVFVGTSNSLVIYGPPVVPTSGPVAPSNAGAVALTFNSVNVTWQDNSNNEDYFSIQRSTSAGGPFVEVGQASANATSFVDTNNLLSETTYYYQVKAHNIFQGGTFSAATSPPVSVTTPQAPPIGTGDGLAARYWSDPNGTTHFSGNPVITRVDPQVNFPGSGSPGAPLGTTLFSVKWTGRVQAQYTETYTFFTESDDGVRLLIKPTTSGTFTSVINDFGDHAPTEDSGTFAMSGGQVYDIEMDFYQNGGGWEAELLWSSARTLKDFVPKSQLYSGVAPAGPTALAAAAVSGTSINVTWHDNSNNEAGFTLERTNPDNSITNISLPPNTSSYVDTALTSGLTYKYRVQATNFAANSAFTSQMTVTMPLAPPTPSNGHVTAVTTTSISLAWQLNSTNSINQETGVRIFRKTGSAGTFIQIVDLPAGTTSYTDNNNGSGLLTGQFYDYHIQAYNLAGFTDFTGSTVDTLTLPPSGLSATPGVGLINLSWTAPTKIPQDGVTYNVYRGTAAGAENSTPIASGLTSTSYADVTATPGQPYFYLVKCVDTGGASAASNEVNSTANPSSVPTPGSLTATAVGNQINLSWNSVGSATSYKVYRSTSPGGEGVTPIATGVTATTFSDPNRQPGLSYYYQVTAVNGSGESARSNEAVAVLPPAAPTNVDAAVDSESTNLDIVVTWDASPGAASYNVFRGSTPGGEGSTPYATGVMGTTFEDPGAGASPGVAYYYTVVAINAGGQSAPSSEVLVATAPVAPVSPAASIRAAGNVLLTWSAPTGAQTYNIYRSAASGGEGTTPLVTGLVGTSYVDSAVSNGGSFYYQVTAVGLGGESVKSTEVSVAFTNGAPQGPANLAGNPVSASQINLTWTAPAGTITGYNVFRGTTLGGEGGTPVNASPITTTSFNDTGLTPNTTYYYTVRATNVSGTGPASNEATATTQLLVPTATITPLSPSTVTAGPSQMTIVWNEAVSGFTISSLSLTRSGGANLLTGAQTLTTSDNITFTLNNLASLDVFGGNYTLKFTAAGSNVVDSMSHTAVADASTSFVVLPVAPEVNAVYVSGSAWQQTFLTYLANNNLGDSQLGYRLTGGPNQLKSLPWTNVNVVSVLFSRDVNVNTANLALVGSSDLAAAPALSGATFSYNSTTHIAKWVYHTALPLNKYLLSIPSASVTSVASGQALDGEFANGSGALLPSGDAVAGGNFNFRFNILPGDVDQDGVVTGLDGNTVRQHFMQFTTTAGYNPLLDTYGKGAVTGVDLLAVQAALLTQLPTTDPIAPGGGGSAAQGSGAALAALSAPTIIPSTSPAPTASGNGSTSTTSCDSSSNSSTATSAASTTPVSVSLASVPVVAAASVPKAVPVATSLPPLRSVSAAAHEALFAALGGGASAATTGKPAPAAPASVTALNSLGLSAARHGGWMQAHDAVFARLDAAPLAMNSASSKTRKVRR